MRKRIAALLLAVPLITAAGCTPEPGWTYENEAARMTSGTYIYKMVTAYYDAYAKLGTTDEETGAAKYPESPKEVFGGELDGIKGTQWIEDKAETAALEYMGAEKKFQDLNLELSLEQMYTAQSTTYEYWGYFGSVLDQNKVAYGSLYNDFLNVAKRNAVFSELYKEGGEYAGDEAALKKEFSEAYGKGEYMSFYKRSADTEAGETQEAVDAEIKKMAGEYLERYKEGEAIEDLVYDYNVEQAKTEEDKAAVTKPEEGSQTIVVSEDSTASYSSTLIEGIRTGKTGEAVLLEDSVYFYVVKPLDVMADPEDYTSHREELLKKKHEEEYAGMLEAWGREGLVENKWELGKYKAKKLNMDWSY